MAKGGSVPSSSSSSSSSSTSSSIKKVCDGCATTQDKLACCSACRSAYFCGKECQRASWPRHFICFADCKVLRALPLYVDVTRNFLHLDLNTMPASNVTVEERELIDVTLAAFQHMSVSEKAQLLMSHLEDGVNNGFYRHDLPHTSIDDDIELYAYCDLAARVLLENKQKKDEFHPTFVLIQTYGLNLVIRSPEMLQKIGEVSR